MKMKCLKCENAIEFEKELNKEKIICLNCKVEYPVYNEVIDCSFLTEEEYKKEIEKTIDSFGYQWTVRDTGHNEGSLKYTKQLFFDRYAMDEEEFSKYIKDKIVWDPAIGSGRMEYIYAPYAREIYATDLSIAVYKAREHLKDKFDNIKYFRANLLNPPFFDESFDVILCHAIIQHTGAPKEALKTFKNKLKKDGILFVDFYKKATPIREFTDDFIRKQIQKLPKEEADKALKPLTKLAEEFYKYEVEVPEDIPYLDIKKGKYNLQRLMYYKFLKLFWNEHMSFEDNHNVMFDWFYPEVADRYSVEEVKTFFKEIPELKIEKFVVLEGGIGVIARKS